MGASGSLRVDGRTKPDTAGLATRMPIYDCRVERRSVSGFVLPSTRREPEPPIQSAQCRASSGRNTGLTPTVGHGGWVLLLEAGWIIASDGQPCWSTADVSCDSPFVETNGFGTAQGSRTRFRISGIWSRQDNVLSHR